MRFHQWRLLHHNHPHHRRNILPLPSQQPPPSSHLPPTKIPFSKSPPQFNYSTNTNPTTRPNPNPISLMGRLFAITDDQRARVQEQLSIKVSALRNELVNKIGEGEGEGVGEGEGEGVNGVLEEMGVDLFGSYGDGSALVELLGQLIDFPNLALQVFIWRRNHAGLRFPLAPQEYAEGIRVAGRAKKLNLAVELFTEAVNNGTKTPSIYNSLLTVYMMNGMADKCQSLFREFKSDGCCSPTVVTYNILISMFARMTLVDRMEETLQEMYDADLSPTLGTFNSLIAGYVTAWMWDRMESTYMMMNVVKIKPDENTFMLMIRGYAHSGNLGKMEKIYERGKHLFEKDAYLIHQMICAYCKNSCDNRIEKIDSLIKLIPKHEYKPWLIVFLIKVYAEELALEQMEKFINIAFEGHMSVHTVHVMRAVITAYYHLNAVENLNCFVKRAELAGWRICRSLYHCKMVLYANQNRLEEMENVLGEMEKVNIPRTIKSLSILYRAYSNWGPRCKLEQVQGLMCKLGYGIRLDGCPS